MKKMILSAMALFLLVTGCGANANTSAVSLYDRGLKMAQVVDKMAEDDAYLALFSTNDELKQIAQEIGSQDYTTPKTVYAITGAGDMMLKMADLPKDETLQRVIEQKTSSAWTTQVNSLQGTVLLAATSILLYDESFVYEGLKVPTTYLYLYDGVYGVTVTYIPYEQNVVRAIASFIKADESLLDMLKQIPNVTVDVVEK